MRESDSIPIRRLTGRRSSTGMWIGISFLVVCVISVLIAVAIVVFDRQQSSDASYIKKHAVWMSPDADPKKIGQLIDALTGKTPFNVFVNERGDWSATSATAEELAEACRYHASSGFIKLCKDKSVVGDGRTVMFIDVRSRKREPMSRGEAFQIVKDSMLSDGHVKIVHLDPIPDRLSR